MGVPGFYKWLFKKFGYDLKEQLYEEEIYVSIPTGKHQSSAPAGEFDNLYIDMNGLIHPCCHPEDGSNPESEDEMLINIMKQLDRIVGAIKPKNLLYLSIDGCAPRAKMNQQRSRRFQSVIRNSNDMMIKRNVLRSFSNFFDSEQSYDEFLDQLKKWDYNVITPGTPFMDKVHCVVNYWAISKLHHPDFKHMSIIFSDSSVPGEGEQKIYDFVRHMREDPQYDPTTTHVIHGLDADLVMLTLLVHEPNFYILREDMFDRNTGSMEKPLHLVNVRRIRNSLKDKLAFPQNQFNFVNVLNDFVLLLYLCGNDFLPSFYGLEVDNDGIERIVNYYRRFMVKEKKHLTSIEDGSIDIRNLIDFIIMAVAPHENDLLRKHFESSDISDSQEQNDEDPITDMYKPFNDFPKQFKREKVWMEQQVGDFVYKGSKGKKVTEESLKDEGADSKEKKLFNLMGTVLSNSVKSNYVIQFPSSKNLALSNRVRNQEKNWRNEFVALKILGVRNPSPDVLSRIQKIRKTMAIEFLRGMNWVWRYYTSDVPSWNWYYPYHFPPFAYDYQFLKKEIIKEEELKKNKKVSEDKMNDEEEEEEEENEPTIMEQILFQEYGAPFLPFRQLMAVLPEDSNHALPSEFREALNSKNQNIGKYYPKKFCMDRNYHQKEFKAHALLPFINSDELFSEIMPIEDSLDEADKKRNSFGYARLYVSKSNELYSKFENLKPVVDQKQYPKTEEWNYKPDPDSYFRKSNGKFMGFTTLPAQTSEDGEAQLPCNSKIVPLKAVLLSPIPKKENGKMVDEEEEEDGEDGEEEIGNKMVDDVDETKQKYVLPNLTNEDVMMTYYFRPAHAVRNFGDLTNFSKVPMQQIDYQQSGRRKKQQHTFFKRKNNNNNNKRNNMGGGGYNQNQNYNNRSGGGGGYRNQNYNRQNHNHNHSHNHSHGGKRYDQRNRGNQYQRGRNNQQHRRNNQRYGNYNNQNQQIPQMPQPMPQPMNMGMMGNMGYQQVPQVPMGMMYPNQMGFQQPNFYQNNQNQMMYHQMQMQQPSMQQPNVQQPNVQQPNVQQPSVSVPRVQFQPQNVYMQRQQQMMNQQRQLNQNNMEAAKNFKLDHLKE